MFSRFCLAVTSGDLNAVSVRFTNTVVSAVCVCVSVFCVGGHSQLWSDWLVCGQNSEGLQHVTFFDLLRLFWSCQGE